MLSFREYLRQIVPPWLSDRTGAGRTVGFRYLYAFALVADLATQRVVEGMRSKFPRLADPSALPYIGRDRVIRRGPNEPDAAYAERLVRWIDDWKHAGNPYATMHQVRRFLYPSKPKMRIVNANGTWYTLNPDDSVERVVTLPTKNWNWDGNSALHARFWLIIYSDTGTPFTRDGVWTASETWADEVTSTWGSTATPEQVAGIRAIVSDWKSSHGVCVNICIAFDSAVFDPANTAPPNPDGTWLNWGKNVAGVMVAARDSRAIYWDGTA
jgi:hypothetical protein